jgi:DNA polymerase I-like protein with 3'-5' exonuclease and polymerase domains/uracil-DNA glycosylase
VKNEIAVLIGVVETKERKAKSPTVHFVDTNGTPIQAKDMQKWYRDALKDHLGTTLNEKGKPLVTVNLDNPLQGKVFLPGPNNPICRKCDLDMDGGAKNPYMDYSGPTDPLITVVFDAVSAKEDEAGEVGVAGPSALFRKFVYEMSDKTGVDPDQIRWVPTTRCAARGNDKPNFKTKGNWCRNYVVQDIMMHRPKLIIPVGTVALGLLSHKSNAQDWGGKMLTFRGWPDDWLCNPDFVLPQPFAADPTKFMRGHPLYGLPPEGIRIPMWPVQSPRLIYATQNQIVLARWLKQIKQGLTYAVQGFTPPSYEREWFHLTEDPDEIIATMEEIAADEGKPLVYDTETTGLKPWSSSIEHVEQNGVTTMRVVQHPQKASIVMMMFRWEDRDGNPRSIGFPWDFETSSLKPHLKRLTPYVLKAMYARKIIGHNLTFDMLFTIATLEGVDLNKLASCFHADTWHQAFTYKQMRGSLGLEILAYDYVPDMAGYEEDMTLLIELHRELLHPGEGKGGHYANCPKDKWDSHLKPYVMGDVEVCKHLNDRLNEKLAGAKRYSIPLAHPTARGKFRMFTPPSRDWVYKNIMSPSAGLLTKFMARGIYVDQNELTLQEREFPKQIVEKRQEFRMSEIKGLRQIDDWATRMYQESNDWELDLENKEQLKTILFDIMKLPVQRLTKQGKKIYGEEMDEVLQKFTQDELREYAAVDKFTLNKLAVDYPEVRPLQKYRKLYKLYTTYIRPLRNIRIEGIDKKERDKDQNLCYDSCIHASFMLTGTRGGRLSCRDPNLQQLSDTPKRIFVSRFGKAGILYQADLSQIELRLLAAACGDKSMVQAYIDNVDLHTLTTSKIFKLPYETFTKEYMQSLQKQGKEKEAKDLELKRRIGKTVNFLTGYGGGAFGLQTTLANSQVYMPIEDCEEIIEAFFGAYPALKQMLGYYKKFIMDNAVAVSLFGRVRIFEEVHGENKEDISKALRAGCNHLIQATASDMMLLSLCMIEACMRDAGLESMLVSTVHDSLLIDAKRHELEQVHEIVDGVLNNMVEIMQMMFGPDFDTSWCIVPFAGDSEIGNNYYDMQKIDRFNVDWDAVLAKVDAEKK